MVREATLVKNNSGTSLVEQTLYYYVHLFFPDAINRYRFLCSAKSYEIDVYIPSLQLAIEYDGSYWHKSKQKRDEEKNQYLNAESIYIIRIREKKLPPLSDFWGTTIINDYNPYVLFDNYEFVNNTFNAITEYATTILGVQIDINFTLTKEQYLSDLSKIYALLYPLQVEPNLSEYCGAEYWCYDINTPLDPKNIPRDKWAHAYLRCPNNNLIILPRYLREYKTACKNAKNDCQACMFSICPFLRYCKRKNIYEPVKCDYMKRIIDTAIKEGHSFYDYHRWEPFHNWLFDESNYGMYLIESYLSRPPKSKYRKNILRFLHLDTTSSSYYSSIGFPAYSNSDIQTLKNFNNELARISVLIIDKTNTLL